MAAADRIIGINSVIVFTPDGQSAITFSADHTTFGLDESIDKVDVSAGNDTDRTSKGTIKSAEFSLTMYDVNLTTMQYFAPGIEGVLNIKPEGVGSSLEEIEMNVILDSRSTTYPFDNVVEIEIAGSRQGAWVKAPGTQQA